MVTKRRDIIGVGMAVIVAALTYVMMAVPGGARSSRDFEPARLAELELDMWQAYYRGERVRLFRGLMVTLREQYHCSWGSAIRVGARWARAASTFSGIRSDYEQVLPDLERGYAVVRSCSDGTFDPAAVARAELAWWVARRIPGQENPENVGRLIAEENALLFSAPTDRVLAASVLRARAGRLRDEGGEHADWDAVSRLLHESYRSLHAALH
jgi:hypothetical protein